MVGAAPENLAFLVGVTSSGSSARGRFKFVPLLLASSVRACLPFVVAPTPLSSVVGVFLGFRGISGFVSAALPWIGLPPSGSFLYACQRMRSDGYFEELTPPGCSL